MEWSGCSALLAYLAVCFLAYIQAASACCMNNSSYIHDHFIKFRNTEHYVLVQLSMMDKFVGQKNPFDVYFPPPSPYRPMLAFRNPKKYTLAVE